MNFFNKGLKAERFASGFLKKKGYKILETNFSSKFGEIDIIAKESDILCFIEVKYRKNRDFGLPEEFVDLRKQKKIIKTALYYLFVKNQDNINIRFDIVAVEKDLKGNFKARLIRNGFEADIE
ncbi:MAG: YraN family protein [Deltaproteobacteria bacterium]|nr:MAG: YraN family protein [Deltaproteobacteria bacterium]